MTGVVVMNLGFDAYRIGEGALFSPSGIERAGGELEPAFFLVDYAPDVDHDQAYATLREEWGNTVLRPTRATDVQQLHDVRLLPVAFSLMIGALAAMTLAFVLALAVRHGRRDLALLRTLGFDGRQLRTSVGAQAVVLVLPAAAVGAVAGLVLGRQVWAAVAEAMGAPTVHVVPYAAVIGVIVGALLLGNLIAAVPGRMAARTHPAIALRAE